MIDKTIRYNYNKAMQSVYLQVLYMALALILFDAYSASTPGKELIIKENVIFKKTKEINVARSEWKVTLVIDLNRYDTLFNQTFEYIGKGLKAIKKTALVHEEKGVKEFDGHFRALRYNLHHLTGVRYQIVNSLNNYKSLHQRQKRSLFPFIGDALGFLFGVSKKED